MPLSLEAYCDERARAPLVGSDTQHRRTRRDAALDQHYRPIWGASNSANIRKKYPRRRKASLLRGLLQSSRYCPLLLRRIAYSCAAETK